MSKEQPVSEKARTQMSFERDYPVRRLLVLISDAWTPIVFHCLRDGEKRFSELQRQLPDISKKVLTQVLRRLERDGLVHRTVYAVVPPKTEYRLTECGQKLHEPIAMLCQWARSNEALINAIYAEKEKSKT
ncbi:MAG: helix-turn-helix transcriptional regulator [Leptolyngbyaceae cyanobacterium SM1_4_3]|nr:helix-turn-helix transcriptional regulator [Leptolyngbyaceae cyanobacterium SM1_4_3]NJN89920.1 helix-turn-helix transcriptional regulator [Leptolyngbyaceae cyanobacterium SL_5_14]